MTYFKTILPLLVLAFLHISAIAQEKNSIPETFSLKEAQDYAAANSYDAKRKKMDVDAARIRVKETTAIGLPQISASGNFQRFFIIPTQVLPDFISPVVLATLIETGVLPPSAGDNQQQNFIPAQFGTDYNISGGISVRQLLFDGSYLVGLQAARTYVEIALNAQEKSEIEIRTNVARAYTGVLLAKQNKENLTQSIATLEKLFAETQALYENGFAEATSVDQLELTLTTIKNNRVYVERQIEVSENLLKFSMGIPVSNPITLSENLDQLSGLSKNPEFLEKSTEVKSHIDFKLALTNLESQNLLLRNAKTSYMPRMSAFYNYQRNYLANDFKLGTNEWFPASILGASIEVPIFTSFYNKNRVNQARIEVEKAEIMKNMVEESLQLEAANSKAAYKAAYDRVETEKKNAELAARIKNNTFIKYKEGLSSSFDLNNAQNQELEAQARYLAAMNELINAKIALERALGSNLK